MGEITEAIATIAKENKDFNRALNVLIKYEIHCLLQRLADTGEEAIVITSDIWDCADLATQKGRTFVRDTTQVLNLKTIFQKYCKGESVTEDDMVSMETTSMQDEMEQIEAQNKAVSSPGSITSTGHQTLYNDNMSPAPSERQMEDGPSWESVDAPRLQGCAAKVPEQSSSGSSEDSPVPTSRSGDVSSCNEETPVDFSWKSDGSNTPRGQSEPASDVERTTSNRRVSETTVDEYTLEMNRLDHLRSRRLSLQQEDIGQNADKETKSESSFGHDTSHSATAALLRQTNFLSYMPLNSPIELSSSLPPSCFSSLLHDSHNQITADLLSGETDILGCHIARRFKELDDQLLHGGCPVLKERTDGELCSREAKLFQNNRGSLAVDIPVCKQDCDLQKRESSNHLHVSPVALKNRILKRLRSAECSTSTDTNCARSISICEAADLEYLNPDDGTQKGSSLECRLSDSEPINLTQELSPDDSKLSSASMLLDRQVRELDGYGDIPDRLDIKLEADALDDMSGSDDMGDNCGHGKHPGPRMRSHSGSLIHLNFTCKVCGQNFKNRQYRDFHVKLHKSPHKFLCNLCNTGFDREDDCLKHQSTHTDPIYQCENCGYKCSREFRMRAHKEICGEPKKIHKCPYCEKQFAAQRYMRIHMKSHDMGNIHTCPYCQNTYPLKNSLLKHIKKKHMS